MDEGHGLIIPDPCRFANRGGLGWVVRADRPTSPWYTDTMTQTNLTKATITRRVVCLASCALSCKLGPRVFRKILANTSLILASTLGGVVACELVLRLVFPKYEHLAASVLRMDQERIWENAPRSQFPVRHPDTGKYHLVRHNDLALRQHRNVKPSTWQAGAHIGFFGDSFLENTLLPVQYSFTEPLDYLLNVAGQVRFNVLNFGVDGYGTEQSYLHYLNFRETNLDYVFYLFCFNDIEDISKTKLFRFDARGKLTNVAANQVQLFLRLLSKLHVTYLVLENSKTLSVAWTEFARGVKGDFSTRYQRDAPFDLEVDREESLRIFGAILRRWKTAVEEAGGAFYVVFLPMEADPVDDTLLKARRVVEQDVGAEAIDLLQCAEERIPGFQYATHIKFRNDAHWNEAGNMLAAQCLYRFIEHSRELPRATETALTDRLQTYYSAFRDDGGQSPVAAERGVQPPVGAEVLAAIRRRYLELDLGAVEALGEAAEKARKMEPTVRAEWDIYALGDALLYKKTGCQTEDTEPRFFLQWVPVEDARDLPLAELRLHGVRRFGVHLDQEFAHADFSFAAHGRVVDGECVAHVPLPPFSVATAMTGQFEEIGEEEYRNVWQANVPLGER